MARTRNSPKRALPVLSIGLDFVEWLSGTGEDSLISCEPAPGQTATELAESAVRAAKSAGMRPGTCILSLGQGMVAQRHITLPGIAPKELRKILARKAGNLVDCDPADTLFSCLPLGHHEDNQEGKWLVLAMRRAQASELRLKLRHRGFKINKVVMGRQAFLAAAADSIEEEEGSRIVVGVETASVSVSLIDGPGLIQQSILPGAFTKSTATMLVQELRGFEAFWRKTSRGQKLDRVVIVGLDAHMGQLLESGLLGALPGVQASFVPPIDCEPVRSSRAEALSAARSTSPFQLDLTLPLPPSRSTIFVMAACMTIIAGIIGFVGRERLISERDGWRDDVRALECQLVDFDDIEDAHALIEKSTGSLRAESERLAEVASEGVPMEAMLGAALNAFDGHGVLLSFNGQEGEESFELSMAGATTGDPMTGIDALESLRDSLEASDLLQEVVVMPPTGVPDRNDLKSLRRYLTFGVHATVTLGTEEEQ
jgi:hypothetical protein